MHDVFHQAVGCALAFSLGAAGCSASKDHAASQLSANVAAAPHQDAPKQQQTPPTAKSDSTDVGSAGRGEPVQQPVRSMASPSAADAGAPLKKAPRPTPVSVDCPAPTGMPQLFAGLTAQPFDAAQFRVQCEACDAPQIWFGQGILCGAATDLAACQSQADAAGEKQNLVFADFLPMFGMTARYVLTTFGSEVHKYQTRDELLQFLGPIDSPQDVLLLLYYEMRGVLCSSADRTQSLEGADPASIVELEDGYQVVHVSQTVGCEGTTTERVTLHVARDGTVTETAREKMLPPNTGCP